MQDPLDISKLAANPCSGLTDAQLAPYVGAIDKTDTSVADSCLWIPADGNQPAVGVYTYPGTGGPASLGKSSFPWSASAGRISGYPAEHLSQGGVTGPETGACETAVAVSDKDTIAIDNDDAILENRYYTKACTLSDALVALVIANLKAGV